MSERVDSLVGLLEEAGVDLLLVTDLVNVRYLTGYSGSNGLAVIGPQTRTFITDFRYVSQAAEEVESDLRARPGAAGSGRRAAGCARRRQPASRLR